MKLLVPVDGSPASVHAFQKSVEIADKYGFIIKLITVVEQSEISSHKRNEKFWHQVDGSIISGKAGSEVSLEVESFRLLDHITDGLDCTGITVEKEAVTGEPYEQILELAQKEGFDLIVMGNRGSSKTKRPFLGSVAQKVLSESKCPVLVIHTDPEE